MALEAVLLPRIISQFMSVVAFTFLWLRDATSCTVGRGRGTPLRSLGALILSLGCGEDGEKDDRLVLVANEEDEEEDEEEDDDDDENDEEDEDEDEEDKKVFEE